MASCERGVSRHSSTNIKQKSRKISDPSPVLVLFSVPTWFSSVQSAKVTCHWRQHVSSALLTEHLLTVLNVQKSVPSTFTHCLSSLIRFAAFMFFNIKFHLNFVLSCILVCHECMKFCNNEGHNLQLHIYVTYCCISRHRQRNISVFSLACNINCECARSPEFS